MSRSVTARWYSTGVCASGDGHKENVSVCLGEHSFGAAAPTTLNAHHGPLSCCCEEERLAQPLRPGEPLTALAFVPQELITKNMCHAAVQQDGNHLQYVPKSMRTRHICDTAVRQSSHSIHNPLCLVPEEIRSKKLCLAALEKSPWALEHFPASLITPDVCLSAVQRSGHTVKFVPDEHITEEICLDAVTNHGTALKWVPLRMRTLACASRQFAKPSLH